VESFHAALRRRVQVANPNLYTFLGHLQGTTTDIDNEIARLNRGLTIRHAKKRANLINDARIMACMSRYDRGIYTRIQFLQAVSHCVGMQDVSNDGQSSDTDDSADDGRSASDQPPTAAVDPQAEMCEVCLIQPRDGQHALVPCGHQRFCMSCVTHIEQQGRCHICRSSINLVLHIY